MNSKDKSYNKTIARMGGFTLLELMMTVGIVALLAGIAIPSYMSYQDKARYTELVTAANPYKTAIVTCFQNTGNLSQCSGGNNGVPGHILNSSQGLTRHVIVLWGRIYVFPNNTGNFTTNGDYYILMPQANNGVITWTYTGPAVTKGYVTN